MNPDQVRAQLSGELPPATLVMGPGAGELVAGVSQERGWPFRAELNAAAAREVVAEAWLASSGVRVTALDMAGSSAAVQNMLLKVLEEPRDGCVFVLASPGPLLATVMSRCQLLSVTAETGSTPPADSRDVIAVGSAVRAARAGNSVQLAQMVREWGPERVRLLTQWAAEAAAGRWAVFSESAAPGVSSEQALRVLRELAVRPGSRLAPVVALQASFPAG